MCAAGEPTDSSRACEHEAVPVDGRFTLEQATDAREGVSEADVLALVFGPDGRTRVQREDRW
jgi:hypothetical protein